MKTNIIVLCDTCGQELNVTNVVSDFTNQIKMNVQPCSNKDCHDGFCDDCEDITILTEKVKMLKQRMENINLIMLPGNKKLKLIVYPECFGDRDSKRAKDTNDGGCVDNCKYKKECIEKTAIN